MKHLLLILAVFMLFITGCQTEQFEDQIGQTYDTPAGVIQPNEAQNNQIEQNQQSQEQTQEFGKITIEMQDNRFSPQTLTIKEGQTVVWKNKDMYAHTVTGFGADAFVDSGRNYEYTFETAGTYDYICKLHESLGMRGRIVVEK